MNKLEQATKALKKKHIFNILKISGLIVLVAATNAVIGKEMGQTLNDILGK